MQRATINVLVCVLSLSLSLSLSLFFIMVQNIRALLFPSSTQHVAIYSLFFYHLPLMMPLNSTAREPLPLHSLIHHTPPHSIHPFIMPWCGKFTQPHTPTNFFLLLSLNAIQKDKHTIDLALFFLISTLRISFSIMIGIHFLFSTTVIFTHNCYIKPSSIFKQSTRKGRPNKQHPLNQSKNKSTVREGRRRGED